MRATPKPLRQLLPARLSPSSGSMRLLERLTAMPIFLEESRQVCILRQLLGTQSASHSCRAVRNAYSKCVRTQHNATFSPPTLRYYRLLPLSGTHLPPLSGSAWAASSRGFGETPPWKTIPRGIAALHTSGSLLIALSKVLSSNLQSSSRFFRASTSDRELALYIRLCVTTKC
jgi:hypothetical protein